MLATTATCSALSTFTAAAASTTFTDAAASTTTAITTLDGDSRTHSDG